MKTIAIAAFTLLLASTLSAADDAAAIRATSEQIVARELASSKAYDTLEYLTDNIGPRLSGSPGAAAAVEWATGRFRAWGIDVTTEPVMVPHWERGEERASLVSHMNQKIVLTALGGSVATPPEGITAEVVEVGSFDELKSLGEKVKGKIVLFRNPMNMEMVRDDKSFLAYRDAVAFRGAGASRAAEQGAVAALIYSVASASLRTPHTGSLRYDDNVPKISGAALTTEDALLVHRLLAKGESVRMHLVLTPRTFPDAQSANVIAEIRGSEHPQEIVLISGHLDSWDLATGAIDDGSGVAMVMETMRLIKEMNLKPRRTIRCVLFMNEENGTRGGKQYADDHKDSLAQHVAAIETDAGAAAPRSFATTLDAAGIEALMPFTAALKTLGAHSFMAGQHTGSDTEYLTSKGVTGFGLTPDSRHYFDYHHSPADTLDKIDPKELAQDSAAVAALSWALAQR
jgi:hypothetical protein